MKHKSLWIKALVMMPLVVGLITQPSCTLEPYEPVTDETGQETFGTADQVADGDLAYDRLALMAAMANYIEYGPDNEPLAYTFALLFAFQNHIGAAISFDVTVNGQFVERRTVASGVQEVIAITNDIVRDSELVTGVITEAIPLLGRPMPFVVRFTNFVCDDDHIVQDMNMILSPLSAFTTNWRPVTKDTPPLILGPHYVCPAVFAMVVEKTRIQVIEVDREDMPDTPDESEADQPEEPDWPEVCTLVYMDEERAVLDALGLTALIPTVAHGCE